MFFMNFKPFANTNGNGGNTTRNMNKHNTGQKMRINTNTHNPGNIKWH